MILVVTVLFTARGAIYGKFVKKPVYSVTATAVIQVDNSSLSEYNAFVYAQYLVNSMAEFIVSDNVTKEVAKVLIDEKYEITHTKIENKIVHYSNKEQKEISEQNYQKMLTSKANSVKSGTKITTKDESLIIKITYSKEEKNENTPDEVLKTVGLIIEKTQEVAKTYKNQTPTRKLPVVESENAVMYAYENKYNLTPVKDADGNIISYVGDKSFTPLELNDFKRLKDYNIFFQINASTIVGKSGFKNKRLAFKLIKEGLIDFISSDIHYNRNNFMKQSYDVINKKFGKDTACELFKTNALLSIK